MNKNIKFLLIIILFGALWGIAEATLGYLLHLIPGGFTGIFMFPIGFYFMHKAYKSTGEHKAIIYTATIAATIKLVDLLLPIRSPMTVLNPATAIILESIVAYAVMRLINEKYHYATGFTAGFAWIFLFPIMQKFIFRPNMGLYLTELPMIALRIGLNTIVSGFLIGLYLKYQNQKILNFNFITHTEKMRYIKPTFVLALAVFFEIGNTLI